MRDDATLVQLARSGDQGAFAELYERYFDRVYDFVARMVRDASEAADLTQDTFLRAMNSLDSLTKGGSFKSWLFTIARNTALNRLERASRTQSLEGKNDAGEEQSYDVVDPDRFGNPEEAAEASGLAALVWEAAAALDPKYRSVLMLNLREGLDSAEIAEVMGVTKNHAYVLVNRMKAALESAVGALALFRNGRRECAELDAVIARLQVGELTPDARRVIEKHAGSCERCQEQRRKLASPFAVFAGLGLAMPAPGVKESIFSQLQSAFANLAPQAAEAAAGNGAGDAANTGAGHGAGTDAQGTPPPSPGPDGPGGPEPRSGTDSASGPEAGPGPTGAGAESETKGTPPVPAAGATGGGSRRRRAIAAGTAAVLLLLLGGVLGVAFLGDDEDAGATLALAESPTSEPTATASPTPPAPATRTASRPATPTARAGTATPTPEPAETALATTAETPGVAAGPASQPPTSAPDQPGAPGPGVAAPPSITPDAGGPPTGSGANLQPPEPPTVTPVPPTITPVPPSISQEQPGITPDPPGITPEPPQGEREPPCTKTITPRPSTLKFSRDATTATFTLTVEGCGQPVSYTASPGHSWVVVTPPVGSIPDGGTVTLVVTVNIGEATSQTSRVHVTSGAGSLDVALEIDIPDPPGQGFGDFCVAPCGGVTPRSNPPRLTN